MSAAEVRKPKLELISEFGLGVTLDALKSASWVLLRALGMCVVGGGHWSRVPLLYCTLDEAVTARHEVRVRVAKC